MKIGTNKKKDVLLLILLAVVGFASFKLIYYPEHKFVSPFQLKVVKVEPNGYGYKILQKNKIFIYQPFVPAIGHKQSFRTKEDARKVGQLMIDRINSGEDFSISREDIHQLQLSDYQE